MNHYNFTPITVEQGLGNEYYRIPKLIFDDEIFSELSIYAKVAYEILYSKISLSRRNKWCSADGRLFVVVENQELMKKLNIEERKMSSVWKELVDVGLISRERIGGLNNKMKTYVNSPIVIKRDYSKMFSEEYEQELERAKQLVADAEENELRKDDYPSPKRFNDMKAYLMGDGADDTNTPELSTNQDAISHFAEAIGANKLIEYFKMCDKPWSVAIVNKVVCLLAREMENPQKEYIVSGFSYSGDEVRNALWNKVSCEAAGFIISRIDRNREKIADIDGYIITSFVNECIGA